MIRVLYVIDTMLRAGAQRHIAAMMQGHDTTRFHPYLLCIQERGELGDDLAREGYSVKTLGLKRIYGLHALRAYPGFIRFLRDERIDIVHAYLFAAQCFAIPAARLAGVPLVIAGRRIVDVYWTAPKYRRARALSTRLSHLLIANSHAVKEYVTAWEGVPAAKVRVVPNGVDAGRFMPMARGEKGEDHRVVTVGYVGSLTRVKQVDVLLRAARQAMECCPEIRVRIVGGGPSTALIRREGATDGGLRELARTLGITGRVTFTGTVSSVENELREMDIFVMPSQSEGMSNAVLEAMAAGLPVCATGAGGNLEVIEHGRTGYFFPNRDDETLAGYLIDLARDREKRNAMGVAARERVRRDFTLGKMVAAMERCYEDEFGERQR